jgi:hypothetical protein
MIEPRVINPFEVDLHLFLPNGRTLAHVVTFPALEDESDEAEFVFAALTMRIDILLDVSPRGVAVRIALDHEWRSAKQTAAYSFLEAKIAALSHEGVDIALSASQPVKMAHAA